MALALGTAFEAAVAAALRINPDSYDPGSMTIDLINDAGPTTVRYTQHYALDTSTLKTLISDAITPLT